MIRTIDHGPVRELRLDRPPANAFNPELIAALKAAVAAAPEEGARALVVSGAPGMYSGGLDVPDLLGRDRPAIQAAWRDFYSLLLSLAASPIPVAAAITGHSPAGGAVIALYCDWRVMAEGNFKIGFNEVQVGIPMPPVILAAVRRLVGPHQAERLCVGALLISPTEAARIGLVDELAAPELVVERAVEWCRDLLALPPNALERTRRRARADLVHLFDRAQELEVPGVIDDWFSAETQLALRALVERLGKKKD